MDINTSDHSRHSTVFFLLPISLQVLMVEEEVKEDVVVGSIQFPAVARGLRFAPTVAMDVPLHSSSLQG